MEWCLNSSVQLPAYAAMSNSDRDPKTSSNRDPDGIVIKQVTEDETGKAWSQLPRLPGTYCKDSANDVMRGLEEVCYVVVE